MLRHNVISTEGNAKRYFIFFTKVIVVYFIFLAFKCAVEVIYNDINKHKYVRSIYTYGNKSLGIEFIYTYIFAVECL